MTLYFEPQGEHLRIDTSVTPGAEILSAFDPMISKLVVWGETREEAAKRMQEALSFYGIHGIHTNISYLMKLIVGKPFLHNAISTKFCDEHTEEIITEIRKEKDQIPRYILLIGYLLLSLRSQHQEEQKDPEGKNLWDVVGFWRHLMNLTVSCDDREFPVTLHAHPGNRMEFTIDGRCYKATIRDFEGSALAFTIDGEPYSILYSEDKDHRENISIAGHIFTMKRMDFLPNDLIAASSESIGSDHSHVNAPMPGKVIKIHVKPGDEVKKGNVLLILEAMKMENNIIAFRDAKIKEVNVNINNLVEVHTPLVVFED